MRCLTVHKINVVVLCNRRKRPRFGQLGCMATAMAVYAGLWTWICSSFGLLSWVGFAGCTSYFACGKRYVQGATCATAANVSGAVWAMLSILLAECSTWTGSGAIFCAFISFAIIMQSKIRGVGIYLRVIYWMLCDVCSRRRWETGNTNSPFGNTSGMDDGSDRRMDVSKSQMIKIRIYKEKVAYPRRGSGSLFFYGL